MLYDLIIIGAGPSGVSSALYATSRGLNTLVIEETDQAGGTLKKVSNITHFAGFPTGESGQELSKLWTTQLKNSNVTIVQDKIVSSKLKEEEKIITGEKDTYTAKAVIISAGTSQNKPEVKATESILKNHLHNDAVKDFKNYKNAVVLGGSDGAAKETLYLSKQLDHVDMVVQDDALKSVAEFTTPILESKNITVHLNSKLIAVQGEQEVESITLKNLVSDEQKELPQKNSGIFYYIGSSPNTKAFEELKTENGYIVTNDKMETNIKGIYAAGDIIAKTVRQISTSVSDGAIAGIEASKYLK